ncbi:origin recognition complex subunit [Cyclospora cayetanensis]|uniref:Origin recognition complex subunit 2 n=1 Tax=Cyclospora cayetanensis TaxID=88456 RepID=A0A1D3D965_9EIME|nr:origin recognition complex subunit [Cyclospora cayetanensis]
MAPSAADKSEDLTCSVLEEGDAEWLVRQFGRYRHLLQTEAAHGAGLAVPAEFNFGDDFDVATTASSGSVKTLPAQHSVRARRLLQLSNRQHQERLQSMQQLSSAHARLMRHGGPDGSVAAEASTSVQEEANPLLLAAYDLLTSTSGSTSGGSESLPKSLLEFMSSLEQRKTRPAQPVGGGGTSGGRSKRLQTRGGREATGHPQATPESSSADSARIENDGERQGVPGDEELHPIRQLQESVLSLPEQNRTTKERLMREQLRLLAIRWKCLLLSGWNILVAGCGSKGRLMRNFSRMMLTDGFCCILNVYQREFKLHQALLATCQVVRYHLRTHNKYSAAAAATIPDTQAAAIGGASASCERLVKELKALLKQSAHPLYLVVLGLDSSTLTDSRRHLAALAACDEASQGFRAFPSFLRCMYPFRVCRSLSYKMLTSLTVRLICTADHIQHALLLDAAELRDFRFVFETAHTRRDYRDEVLSRWGSMCGFVPGWLWTASRRHGSGMGGSSVNFEVVLRGLTTNHKRLLRGIAELQLAQIERNESPIVSLADLGTETSGVSLFPSRLKLKELLVEVTSHGAAVHAKKNGQEAVAIRANKVQLQELLELLDKAGL